jgi:pimeloyl-ACP methyl ester carboxylesterase
MSISIGTGGGLSRVFAAAACAAVLGSFSAQAQGGEPAVRTARVVKASAPQSGLVEVNGIAYHYQIHGTGEPLLLLHGGLMSTEGFGPVLAILAQRRRVIGVDLHGHGRTSLGTRSIDLVDIGNDLAALLDRLAVKQADVLGYSFGAGAALRLAIQHPARIRRLALVSAVYSPQDGYYPDMLAMQAQVGAAMAGEMKGTPMYETYAKVAPRPQDFPKLLDQMGAWMRKPYDWSADVTKLGMPVMLVYPDSDMIRPEHMVRFYQLLGGGLKDAGWAREHMSRNRLAILPGLTHYDVGAAPVTARTVLPFLNGNDVAWLSGGRTK